MAGLDIFRNLEKGESPLTRKVWNSANLVKYAYQNRINESFVQPLHSNGITAQVPVLPGLVPEL